MKHRWSKLFAGVIALSSAYGLMPGAALAQGGCQPSPGGLEAWWPLDETSGTVVADVTGNHPGTATNAITSSSSPKAVAGFVQGGLNFYAGHKVNVAASSGLDFGTSKSFTIDAWVKGRSSPIVSNFSSSSGNSGFQLLISNSGTLALAIGGTTITTWNGPPIPIGVWTFVAAVVNRGSNTVTLYVGPALGVLSTASPTPPLASTHNAGMGQTLKIGGCSGNPFGCDTVLDEVEIFNRALTPNEIQTIFDAGSAGKCRPPPPSGNFNVDKSIGSLPPPPTGTAGTQATVSVSCSDGYNHTANINTGMTWSLNNQVYGTTCTFTETVLPPPFTNAQGSLCTWQPQPPQTVTLNNPHQFVIFTNSYTCTPPPPQTVRCTGPVGHVIDAAYESLKATKWLYTQAPIGGGVGSRFDPAPVLTVPSVTLTQGECLDAHFSAGVFSGPKSLFVPTPSDITMFQVSLCPTTGGACSALTGHFPVYLNLTGAPHVFTGTKTEPDMFAANFFKCVGSAQGCVPPGNYRVDVWWTGGAPPGYNTGMGASPPSLTNTAMGGPFVLKLYKR